MTLDTQIGIKLFGMQISYANLDSDLGSSRYHGIIGKVWLCINQPDLLGVDNNFNLSDVLQQ